MSFDEQLRRLFDTALNELTDEARADVDRARQDALEEGRRRGLDEGRQQGIEQGRQQGVEEGRQQGIEDGRSQARDEARALAHQEVEALREAAAVRPSDTATLDRLVDSFRALDRARSLSEVLDTVAACAVRETSRAAILLVREPSLRGWRFIGFDEPVDAGSFETALADAAVIAAAIATNAAATDRELPAFARPSDGECFALPLEVGGAAVAVLYADGFDEAARAGGVVQRLEALGRHASRTLEALTALKAARALVQAPGGHPSGNGSSVDDADSSAKRYAKLLVSEIKLYHEPAVVAGRRDRDLAMRLGGEIARARVLYEQRVPQTVRSRTDYFRDELVRTLANGDATLLQLNREAGSPGV
jgi:hypothetical protein